MWASKVAGEPLKLLKWFRSVNNTHTLASQEGNATHTCLELLYYSLCLGYLSNRDTSSGPNSIEDCT